MEGFAIILMLGLAALFGAGVVLGFRAWRVPSRPYPSCGGCGYDLSGTLGADVRCPECGAHFAEVGVQAPTTGRRRTLLVAGIVLATITFLTLGIGAVGARFAYVRALRAQQQAIAAHRMAQQQLRQQLQMQLEAGSSRAVVQEEQTTIAAERPAPDGP